MKDLVNHWREGIKLCCRQPPQFEGTRIERKLHKLGSALPSGKAGKGVHTKHSSSWYLVSIHYKPGTAPDAEVQRKTRQTGICSHGADI